MGIHPSVNVCGIALVLLSFFTGCRQTEPAYRMGYDRFASEWVPVNAGVAAYLHSLRPLLPVVASGDFNHQSDTGQDYLVLLNFSYWETSIDRVDLETGELARALPPSQLLEGYPKYVIVEGGLERWVDTLMDDGYDATLYRYELMSMDYPSSALDPTLQMRLDEKKFRGAILGRDRAKLFDFRSPIEEILRNGRYRVLLDALVWDATDVYVLYGRLEGVEFGRIIINPDFDRMIEAYAADVNLGVHTEDSYASLGIDQDLRVFYRFLKQIVEHQHEWSDEFKEESTMGPHPGGHYFVSDCWRVFR